MERLTKIDGCGQNDLIRCFDCGPEKAGENLENCGYCSEGWQRALNRLAAYEDTGLEPEDIKKAFNEGALLKLTAQHLGTTPDRLREWAKAEQEGRLVVLPCKVGDTVYKINRGDYAHHWKLFVQEGTVTEISWKNNRSGKDLGFAIIVRFNYEARVRFKFSNIGKTVFLTREEAETALAGERKDGEG